MLEDKDFDKVVLEAVATPILKEKRLVGYSHVYNGVKIFLPASLSREKIVAGDVVRFRLVEKGFDPYNLIAIQIPARSQT